MTENPPLVQTATDRGVATLTLDSPANRNALSTPLMTQLRAGLADAVADPSVRVIRLDHTGPVFCSGADLAETERARAAGQLPVAMLADLLAELWECPKPLVAQVGGPARAGGIGVLAAADIAISSDAATFAFSEVRLGVIPAVISATVLPRLTPGAAARLYLTGEVVDARYAAQVGLVTEAVPTTELASTVANVCDALVRGAPAAVAGTKQLLRERAGIDIRADLAHLSAASVSYFQSADAREGVAAFREKRDPQWVVAARQ
ncbi:enoyl-CoA hydratase/isomerase family protein [Natronosporangium hydrolyticum]|uniref:Enoyl-CoA hydratase/isomerase family protein n=1 Tax=Natronosporangium hydrolyticum TaxID=2811111 RepID=A0A895YE42_9ACTN|nr:enoyl-CoA hydratase-related protein [Natronosporangium hydrolyticum]QSB16094.1 enoyl-CoA hydratase/isomerase family protein [Natronosporangium hydrolyticum]